ncbi:MAG TPA: N-acetylmuramoyl-L-alanine amidase [Candidatus Atribacteria bacterium]|nr:N-acetylmuramoyl-L-alanine amidase [Candidatus Atribacteria bacterium]
MKLLYISKKWTILLWMLLALLVILIMVDDGRMADYAAVNASPLKNKIIVIDAGHGGFDSGAVSPSGTREDVLNLQVALKLQKLLTDNGAKVVMTRRNNDAIADNKSSDMKKRVEIIKSSDPDIVISIHMNKFGQSKYYGGQTFYLEGSTESKKLAELIQRKIRENLIEGNTRQIKAVDNLLILKAVSAPSVVVECGFLSNPKEESLLKRSDYQDMIAWCIYNGILEYLVLGHPDLLEPDD